MIKRLCAVSLLTVLGLTLAWLAPHARAQEGDLTSSAGVFIDPPHAKARRARSDGAAERAPTTRRTHPRTQPTPKPTPTPVKGPAPVVTAESLNAKAEGAIDAKRFADAVAPLKQAVQLKPGYAEAQYNLG